MRCYGRRDDQWDPNRDLLSGRPGTEGVTAWDNRLCVEAVLYRYHGDLPDCCKNVHRRFSRWAETGVWEKVFQRLAAEADNESAMIDGTIVHAHQHSAGARKKLASTRRSRGGLSTKIHTLVDAFGNPVGFHLTGGEDHHQVGADALLPDMRADMLLTGRVIKPLTAAGKTAVIPSMANRQQPRAFDRDTDAAQFTTGSGSRQSRVLVLRAAACRSPSCRSPSCRSPWATPRAKQSPEGGDWFRDACGSGPPRRPLPAFRPAQSPDSRRRIRCRCGPGRIPAFRRCWH